MAELNGKNDDFYKIYFQTFHPHDGQERVEHCPKPDERLWAHRVPKLGADESTEADEQANHPGHPRHQQLAIALHFAGQRLGGGEVEDGARHLKTAHFLARSMPLWIKKFHYHCLEKCTNPAGDPGATVQHIKETNCPSSQDRRVPMFVHPVGWQLNAAEHNGIVDGEAGAEAKGWVAESESGEQDLWWLFKWWNHNRQKWNFFISLTVLRHVLIICWGKVVLQARESKEKKFHPPGRSFKWWNIPVSFISYTSYISFISFHICVIFI
jgi:hypothetical protein